MTVEVKSSISDGIETVKITFELSDTHDLNESLQSHVDLGFELDGREYTDGYGERCRLLSRPVPDVVEEASEEIEANSTAAAVKLAAEAGLDLGLVEGSGSGGRVGVGDVRDFLAEWEGIDESEEKEEEEVLEDKEGEEEVAGWDSDPGSPDFEDDSEDVEPLPFEEEDEEDGE